jgi:hypothetical protein
VILSEAYLSERGLSLEFTLSQGIEIDSYPERIRIQERLGQKCVPIWNLGVSEIIWFPIKNASGKIQSWFARPLPTLINGPKFVAPVDSGGAPFVTASIYEGLKTGHPVIITEGPVKALACQRAGKAAVGLVGVWGGAEKNSGGKLVLRKELAELGLRGRKVYIAFDADTTVKPEVRHASIRLYFLLSAAGAEVYQLTSWDLANGKGIDDYLVGHTREASPRAMLEVLLAQAAPFAATIANNKIDLDAVTSELRGVSFDELHRSQLCKPLAKALGVPVEELRKIGTGEVEDSSDVIFEELEPWPEEVNINELLQDLVDLVRKHVILDDYSILTVVFWVLLTYLSDYDRIDTMPILSLVSPEKRCGKTRLQSVLDWLVYRALSAANVSSASIYRAIERWHPTLLLDEVDSFIMKNEELRGILNSGHTREKAYVIRCHPTTLQPERFSTWCPKSFALIGHLPETLRDRSIAIRMERKKRGEKVRPLRATTRAERAELRRKISRWIADNGDKLEEPDPAIVEQLNDRAADNWVPIMQIARLAGGVWPLNVLRAVTALTVGDEDGISGAENIVGILLIRLQKIFYETAQAAVRNSAESQARAQGKSDQEVDAAGNAAVTGIIPGDRDFISTEEILKVLNDDKEAPWADWCKGNVKGLSAKRLGQILGQYKVKSVRLKRGGSHGYRFGDLRPVFERYIPYETDGGLTPSE